MRPAPGQSGLSERATVQLRWGVMQAVDEFGLARVTVDEIIAKSGVGRAALYRRWRSRDDLLAFVVRAHFDDLLAQVGQQKPGGQSVSENSAQVETTLEPQTLRLVVDVMSLATRDSGWAGMLQPFLSVALELLARDEHHSPHMGSLSAVGSSPPGSPRQGDELWQLIWLCSRLVALGQDSSEARR